MTSAISLVCAALLAGQDLSLATILIDGEGWKPAPGAQVESRLGPQLEAKGPAGATYAITGKAPGRVLEHRAPPLAAVLRLEFAAVVLRPRRVLLLGPAQLRVAEVGDFL